MSKLFDILFRLRKQGDGAQQAAQDLREVGQEAGNIDASPIDTLREKMDAGRQKASELATEARTLAEQSKTIGGQAAQAGKGLSGMANGTSAAATAAKQFSQWGSAASAAGLGLGRAFTAIGTSLKALMTSNPLGWLILALNLLVVAFQKGMQVLTAWRDKLADTSESAAIAAAALDALEKSKLTLKGQRDAVGEMIKGLDQARSLSERLRGETDKLETQRLKSALASVNLREATDISAAGGDDTAIAAIKARAAQERAALEATTEKAAKEREILAEQEREQDLIKKNGELQDAYGKALVAKQNAQQGVQNMARELGISDKELGLIRQDPNRLSARIKNAEENVGSPSGRMLGDPAKLKTLQAGLGLESEASSSVTAIKPQLEGVVTELQAINMSLERLSLEREQIATDTSTQAVELGTGSMSALQGIKDAISQQQRVVDAARAGLAGAQRSSAPDAAVQQNTAYAGLQAAEAELARLQSLAQTAATAVDQGSKTFGDAFTAGATAVVQQAVSSAPALEAGAEAAAASIDASAAATVAASDAAATQITGAIQGFGQAVQQAVIAEEQRFQQVVDRLQRLESTIGERRGLEADMVREIKTLQSQVRNTR